jgi:hypothetical protein
LPNARFHKILMLRRSERCGKRGLFSLKPLQLFIESAAAGYVLFGHHLIRGTPVGHLPPLVVKGAHLRDRGLAKLDNFCTYSIRAKFSRRMTI